jgi:hypothetical protein
MQLLRWVSAAIRVCVLRGVTMTKGRQPLDGIWNSGWWGEHLARPLPAAIETKSQFSCALFLCFSSPHDLGSPGCPSGSPTRLPGVHW